MNHKMIYGIVNESMKDLISMLQLLPDEKVDLIINAAVRVKEAMNDLIIETREATHGA